MGLQMCPHQVCKVHSQVALEEDGNLSPPVPSSYINHCGLQSPGSWGKGTSSSGHAHGQISPPASHFQSALHKKSGTNYTKVWDLFTSYDFIVN